MHIYQKKQENEQYHKELAKYTSQLEFFRADQKAENLMFCPRRYGLACVDAGKVCMVDICCDLLGSNSQCPFYLSAEEDATKFDISGMPSWSLSLIHI